MGESRSNILPLTALGAPTKTQDRLSLDLLMVACHKFARQDTSLGRELSITLRADSMLVEASIEEAIRALASELDRNTCNRLLRISDCPWLGALLAAPMLVEEEEGSVLTLAAPESSIRQKWYIMVKASNWVMT